MTQRLKVTEGNLVLECNNYMHPLLVVRTQSTSDRDSEVATKDRDSLEVLIKHLDGKILCQNNN